MLIASTKTYRSGVHQFITYGSGSNTSLGSLNTSVPLEVMRLTSSNVGIGTTIAKRTLDVQGDINFSGGLFQNGIPFTSGQTSQWTSNTSNNTLYYLSNVGIGTTFAKRTLDVQGDINFSGGLFQNGVPFTSGQSSQWTSNANTLYYLSNVGIGTTIAKRILDVQGDINFSGNLFQRGNVNMNLQNYPFASSPVSGRYNLSAHNITSNYKVGDNITDWSSVQAFGMGTIQGPIYMQDEYNIPYVSFNGINTTNGAYLNFGTQTFNLLTNNGLTFGAMVRFTAENTWERLFDFGNGAGVNNILAARSGFSKDFSFQLYAPVGTLTSTANNVIANNAWQIYFMRLQQTSTNNWETSIWLNGSLISSNTTANSTFTNNYTLANCYVARSGWSSDNFASFDLREFSLFDRPLTTTEILSMTNYYTQKYNITQSIQPTLYNEESIIANGRIGIGTLSPISDFQTYNHSASYTNISSTNYKLHFRIQCPNIQQGAVFGTTCAVSGNGLYLAVSATGYDGPFTDIGAVYVYYWNQGCWNFINGFTSSDPALNDAFGQGGIAISYDGTILVASSIAKNTNTGKVYIYSLATSTFNTSTIQTLTGTTSGDYFGSGLAINGDGRTLVIGAYGRTQTVTNQGVVYVYNLTTTQSTWSLTTTLVSGNASTGGAAAFGYANAISRDGTVIISGAYLHSGGAMSSGAITVFRLIGGTWSQRAFTYEPSLTTTAFFGQSVACSVDASTIVVSATGYDTSKGRVYVYRYTRGTTDTLTLLQQITTSVLVNNSYFSRNLSISSDAKTLLVSAYGINTTYVYRINASGNYFIYQTITGSGYWGYGLGMSADGGTVMITSPTTTVSTLTNVGTIQLYRMTQDVNILTGRLAINANSTNVTSSSTNLNIRGQSSKINVVSGTPTTTDVMRIESQDASPCCLNIGLLSSDTTTAQGYYINAVEPGVSDARVLLLQPFSTSSFVGIGTTSPLTLLHVNGTITSIGLVNAPKAIMARRVSAAQTINSTTDTVVKFDAADTYDNLSSSSGLTYNNTNGTFTNTSGAAIAYQVSYQIAFNNTSTTGARVTWIWINGTGGTTRYGMMNIAASSDFPVLTGTATINLANNDSIQVWVWQSSGVAIAIGGGYAGMSAGYSTRVQIVRL